MSIEERLKQLCKDNGEVEIEYVDMSKMAVDVLLPYETTSHVIELEGSTDDEVVESFKDGVNKRLDDMINHLEDCKF